MAWLESPLVFWSAITLGAIALLVFAWAFGGDRARGRRRCPNCWYDMGGIEGLRCPECGKPARSERHLHKHRRRKRAMLAALTLLLLAVAALARPIHQRTYIALNTGYRLVDQIDVQGVQVKHFRFDTVIEDDWRDDKIEVWSNGTKILRLDAERPMIGGSTGYGNPPVGRGESADGPGGNPDIVITLDSGGNRCCETVYVLSINTHPYDGRISLSIDAVIDPGGRGTWDDVDGDGIFEYLTHDPQFSCGPWMSCAESPSAPIILAWNGRSYAPSRELMLKVPPTPGELVSIAQSSLNQPKTDYPRPFVSPIQTAIPMIYHGNALEAEQLIHMAWRDDMVSHHWSTPDELWADIWSVIDAGPYGTFIRGLNAR